MPDQSPSIPYCGRPPAPDQLLGRWNLDPILLAALALIAALYVLGARRGRAPAARRRLFYAGWALTSLALVSPLCPLSVSLFSARVGQHMILTLVAAPLVALGRPVGTIGALFGRAPTWLAAGPGAAKTAIVAAALYAGVLWYWHTPVPYALTFESALVYWLMHLTLFGSALFLWAALLAPSRPSPGWAIGAGLFSTIQMGLLGAAITFAPMALFAPHFLTTWTWGLTPLEDQQLGGVIMWVPGCLVFLAAAMVEMWRALADPSPGAAAAPVRAIAR